MPTLTANQKTTLQAIGVLTDRGYSCGPPFIEGTNNLYIAACWSWALTGIYTSVAAATSAAYIYENILVWGNGMASAPTAVNELSGPAPSLIAAHQPVQALINVLKANLGNAKNNANAQQNFRIAMMKIVSLANGFTLNNNNVDHLTSNANDVADANLGNYAIHMKSTSWYGWDHWGISVLLPNGQRSFIQKVNGNNPSIQGYINGHVFRNCNALWDGAMPQTSIGVIELLQPHIDIIIS